MSPIIKPEENCFYTCRQMSSQMFGCTEVINDIHLVQRTLSLLFSCFLVCSFFAILAILHLCLLRYFPSTNLVDRADNCYTSLYFYFSSFSMFIQSRILKLVVICSCCSFLFLLSTFFILLFSTLLSISCSVFSLFIQFIF